MPPADIRNTNMKRALVAGRLPPLSPTAPFPSSPAEASSPSTSDKENEDPLGQTVRKQAKDAHTSKHMSGRLGWRQ